MSYPKQPGQDADAHRALAQRHLAVIHERDSARAQLARTEARLREAEGIIERVEGVALADHPHQKRMRDGLDSGELARRLKVIGKDFDPTGCVALLLDARAFLESGR